jgi:hypothetical protein
MLRSHFYGGCRAKGFERQFVSGRAEWSKIDFIPETNAEDEAAPFHVYQPIAKIGVAND